MKKIFFSCLATITWALCPLLAFGQQEQIDILTGRFIEKQLERAARPQSVDGLLETLLPDGSWPDIDYTTVSADLDAMRHLNRLIELALAYRQPGNPYTGSVSLQNQIVSGLDYFQQLKPRSTNWWYQDIGSPEKYMIPLILLKGHIDPAELHRLSAYLEDRMDNVAHRGKNRTWVSVIALYKGCIEDDYALIRKGFESIASTIEIVDVQGYEGMKIDDSFHQHRPQLYSGGYGMSFVADLAEYIALSVGTDFEAVFTPEKKQVLSNILLGGHRLFGYRNGIDFGTIGRNICRPGCISNIAPWVLELMERNDPAHADEYRQWRHHIEEHAPFPAPGNKYFWKSDIMTHHGENYYLSAKVVSQRTNGTEMLNGENKKGYYLPLGATNILTRGDEYDDIFPVWDWARIPGTTGVPQHGVDLIGYHWGSNRFAGGVSTGKNGIIAFDHVYKGTYAHKAYFFMGDALLCLGSGIWAYRTHDVITSINQCFSRGEVSLGFSDGNSEKYPGGQKNFEDVQWVYHDNVGYILPEGGKLTVKQEGQTGSWASIGSWNDESVISRDIFSLWLTHGNEPVNETYAYIVLPDRPLADFTENKVQHGFRILANTPDVQAVENTVQQCYGIVFYEPGTVELSRGWTVTSDQRAIVYIGIDGDSHTYSVSDPEHRLETLILTVSQSLIGKNVTQHDNHTRIRFDLPQGDYRGSTLTETYVRR